MEKNEQKLSDIFLSRVGICFKENQEIQDLPFLGKELNIPVRELILVYFDIKKVFNMEIPEEEVVNGSFKTFKKLCDMLNRLIIPN